METEYIYNTLVKGIERFFRGSGCGKAVLGLSGGIDSAVVAALAARALGSENVHVILMPSPFSTVHSVTDSILLCDLCHIGRTIIPIDNIYHRFIKDLSPILADTQFDTTEENLQARIRGTILMAYSNKHKALLLNTSNKSELAMGYGTLYGDLAGALMVIADCYKTEVYALANYLNREKDTIPQNIIDKAPSAELHAGQKDSDSLPEYAILDKVLYNLVEMGLSCDEVVEKGFEREIVEKAVKLMARSSFKTMQVPPLIKVSDHPLLPAFKCI